jgi:hypothetical protein
MDKNVIIWTLGAIAAVAFVIVLIIQNGKRKLRPTVAKTGDEKPLFSESEVGKSLNRFVKALSTDDREAASILEKLKASPEEYSKEFEAVLSNLTEDAYELRWTLVYCLSRFESPQFTGLLGKIAKAGIPAEKSKDLHLFSTFGEETSIRLRAIEGIKDIAKSGNREAETVLYELLESNYLTLNIAAAQALIEISESNKSKILDALPKEKHYILEIERKDVKEVAVIKNPEEYVTNRDERNKEIPKPKIGEDNFQDFSTTTGSSKPPQIKR